MQITWILIGNLSPAEITSALMPPKSNINGLALVVVRYPPLPSSLPRQRPRTARQLLHNRDRPRSQTKVGGVAIVVAGVIVHVGRVAHLLELLPSI